MIGATQLISDIKSEFEGGNSLSIEWDDFIRRAVDLVLGKIRPETLKRTVPIYGGLAQELYLYYAPIDILVPSAIYENIESGVSSDSLNKRRYDYVPASHYYRSDKNRTYTIENVNGSRFLVVRHSVTDSIITLDAMNSVGTKTGGTPTLNEHNFFQGSASIEATFTTLGVEFGDEITKIDISDYLKGILLVPAYLPIAANLTSLEGRLKTSDTAYYSVISTADSIGDYFRDGWNMIKFDLANRSTVGSPTNADINEWSLIGTTTANMTIIFDKLTIQQYTPFYFEYYSNRPFATSANVLWQTTIDNTAGGQINFDNDLRSILHYELCLLVERASSFRHDLDFKDERKSAYREYDANHPSSEAPLSYSISPEIDISSDRNYARLQDDTVATD